MRQILTRKRKRGWWGKGAEWLGRRKKRARSFGFYFILFVVAGFWGGGRCVSDLSAGRVRRGAGEAECSDIDTGGPRSKVGKIVGMGGLGWLRRVSRIGERGTLLIVHVML